MTPSLYRSWTLTVFRRALIRTLAGVAAGFVLWGYGPLAWAVVPPIRLCTVESATLPEQHWSDSGLSATGPRQLDFFLLQLLAQKASVEVEIQVLPWRRCLTDVRTGLLDGVFGLSHSLERAKWAAFPMRGDRPDDLLRVRSDAYHWYVRHQDRGSGDGKALLAKPTLRLGAVAGYSVVDELQAQGFRVTEPVQNTLSALRMLALARTDAAALLRTEADLLLMQEPGLAGALVRLEPAIVERAYHLAFGQGFARNNAGPINKLWRTLPAVRESAAWKAAETEANARRMTP